jgi:hypothetical protein
MEIVKNDTGAMKHMKPFRFDLIPPRPLQWLAQHFWRGSQKYADRNWELGQDYSLFYRSALNHLMKWWGGKDYDDDPSMQFDGVPSPHEIDAAIWQLVCLRETIARVEADVLPRELDDRDASGWVEVV